MKKTVFFLTLSLLVLACKKESTTLNNTFGQQFELNKVLSSSEMNSKFGNMKEGDSIQVQFEATIKKVCQKKGCWMTLDLGEDKETMVKFKDYAFFMPLDCEGKTVTVNGIAFVNEVSVDELKHYAEDAGKTKEEIEAIQEPELTYSFLADGTILN